MECEYKNAGGTPCFTPDGQADFIISDLDNGDGERLFPPEGRALCLVHLQITATILLTDCAYIGDVPIYFDERHHGHTGTSQQD